MSPPTYLGIDLGTSNSAAAIFDGTTVTVVRSADGASITPSIVRIDARGRVTVGERARRFRERDPASVRSEFKRLMGTEHALPFGDGTLTRRPEELSAEVLRALREDVRQQFGFVPERAVVTVPALFELPQTRATADAARLAGFERVEVLQEPVASAIAAGWRVENDDPSPWLVYDLGGGTFDVSLLETQHGLLRVVGHDGDNFLGGRDIDAAIVEWLLREIEAKGTVVDRADPANLPAITRLRLAAEEAKIELSRANDALVTVDDLVFGTKDSVDLEVVLTRAHFETLVTPLIEKSIAVCRRLLDRHGLRDQRLSRVVLVGGPTVIPRLRARIADALGAPIGEGNDPMTLVAQGAALFAASVGLDARPTTTITSTSEIPAGPRVWLQYPTVSSDLSPWVVGRIVDAAGRARVARVRLRRDDGAWCSEAEAPDAEGTFALAVSLQVRSSNTFHVEAAEAAAPEAWFALAPATFAVVHGLTLGDPPVPRSIGIALADDAVHVFFERGAPLPLRRTHTFRTVEVVVKDSTGLALDVPIVQGEFPLAHLCRLVGTLRIAASAVNATLAPGSSVEVTLDLDRGGRLTAAARVPSIDQVFDEVVQLVAPRVPVAELRASTEALQRRASSEWSRAMSTGDTKSMATLGDADQSLAELRRDVAAAEGGDDDAAERARRTAMDLDALLAELESSRAWPELVDKAREETTFATSWVGPYGTAAEKASLERTTTALDRAIGVKNPKEIARQVEVLARLRSAAYLRSPGAWGRELDWLDTHVNELTDPKRGIAIVQRGRAAQRKNDAAALEQAVREGWTLTPPRIADRQRGHGSGVR